ncbi:MAG: hypothetical protein V1738_05415 [Patescibacteria group bacterium]
MADQIKKLRQELAAARAEPTFQAIQALRKKLLQSSILLDPASYQQLSAEIEQVSVLAALVDLTSWLNRYCEELLQPVADHKKLAKHSYWAQNACMLALKSLSSELLLQARSLVNSGEMRYSRKVADNPDLLMFRAAAINHELSESDGVLFSEEGALQLMCAYIHLGALQQLHANLK